MILLKTAFGSVQVHFSMPEVKIILFLVSLWSCFINLPLFLLGFMIYVINLYIYTFKLNTQERQKYMNSVKELI